MRSMGQKEKKKKKERKKKKRRGFQIKVYLLSIALAGLPRAAYKKGWPWAKPADMGRQRSQLSLQREDHKAKVGGSATKPHPTGNYGHAYPPK